MHGTGSSGTNVLCTIVGSLLSWASIAPHINKIATEVRIALMLLLLQHYYGIAALVRPSFKQSCKRLWLARAGSRKQDVNTNSDAQSQVVVYPTRSGRVGSPWDWGRTITVPSVLRTLPLQRSNVPRFLDLSPFFSYSCALFCTFSHSCKTQPICFQAIPYSLRNTRGGRRWAGWPAGTRSSRRSPPRFPQSSGGRESPATPAPTK